MRKFLTVSYDEYLDDDRSIGVNCTFNGPNGVCWNIESSIPEMLALIINKDVEQMTQWLEYLAITPEHYLHEDTLANLPMIRAILGEHLEQEIDTEYMNIINMVLLNNHNDSCPAVLKYYAYKAAKNEYYPIEFFSEQTDKLTIESNNEDESIEIDTHRYIKEITQKSDMEFIQKYDSILDYLTSHNIKATLYESRHFTSLHSWFAFLLFRTIQLDETLKLCPNCDRYFYPARRSDTIYCDNISPQDNSKTCKEYGKYNTQQKKLHSDIALKLYKQIYNSKANKVRRSGNAKLKEDLECFRTNAAKWKDNVENGAHTRDEYIEWLQSIKEGGK